MKIIALGVHLLTAVGAALGLYCLVLIYDGRLQEAFWVMAAAVLIDSIDGTLARKFEVTKNAPKIDGTLMDNIADFLTWTIAPLFWAYAALDIPLWVLMICATASIFGFSNTRAKTADYYFLGFPSYWNVIVLYLFLMELPNMLAIAILLFFALLTFAPVKFIYPNRTPFLRPLTLSFGTFFAFQLLLLLYLFDEASIFLIYSSFLFPVYYFGLSFYLNLTRYETS